MKLNDKQVDDIARCLGNIAVAAAIGFAVGLAGFTTKPLSNYDKVGLLIAFVLSAIGMLVIRKGK